MSFDTKKLFRLVAVVAVVYTGSAIADRFKHNSTQITDSEKSVFFTPIPNLGEENIKLDLGYSEVNDGKKYLYIPKGELSKFYLYWKELAKQNLPLSPNSDFWDWEHKSQMKYFDKMGHFIDAMPKDCHGALYHCPEGIPFVDEVNKLNLNYRMSSSLRVWEAQRMERAYIAALMNPEIGEAARNWDHLSRKQKLAIAKVLIDYQFSSYDDVTNGHPVPKLEIVEGIDCAGADADTEQNIIRFSGKGLDGFGVRYFFSTPWHEGRHIISGILREKLSTQEGLNYLARHWILASIEINYYNQYLYSEYCRKDTTREINQAQAEEATSVNDELFGKLLVARLLNTETPKIITFQQAREYFYADFYNSNYPFKMAVAAPYVHAALMNNWQKICYNMDKPMLVGPSGPVVTGDAKCDGPIGEDTSPADPERAVPNIQPATATPP